MAQRIGTTCFRPLSGSKVSERQWTLRLRLQKKGFRPLSGIKVSEQDEDGFIVSDWGSFRPLSGSKVSERSGRGGLTIASPEVSVPSRGLRYLNRKSILLKSMPICFRPLSGIKVSEPYWKNGYSWFHGFPSPLGD